MAVRPQTRRRPTSSVMAVVVAVAAIGAGVVEDRPATARVANPPAQSATLPTPPATGSLCTSNSAPGDDRLRGTTIRDVSCIGAGPGIRNGSGGDAVLGGAGDDRLAGNTDRDLLNAGGGDDACQTVDPAAGVCTLDRTGPVVAGFAAPSVVRSGDVIVFDWRLSDPAGVQNAGVTIGWAPGLYTGCGFAQSGTLVSGTATDGQWSYTCTLPADAVATDYSAQVIATDRFGNVSMSDWVEFRVEGPNTDAAPPTYSDIRIANPARTGQAVTVTWNVQDPSGVQDAIMWFAGPDGYRFADDTGRPYVDYGTPVSRECDADQTSCQFTQTVTVRSDAPAGTWALWISATDVNDNKTLESAWSFPMTAT